MKIKAEIVLSRVVLESLTDEDLRWIGPEVSRRLEELTTVPEINNRPTSDPKLSP